MAIDPIVAMNTISVGLKLVDQFRETALRFMNKKATPPSAMVEQSDNTIQIKHDGKVIQKIDQGQMKLGEWDETRYRALERRVRYNWDLFNELFAQNVGLSVDESARIKLRMEKIQEELCEDFREMVKIYERSLGTGLPDHYSLYEVCS